MRYSFRFLVPLAIVLAAIAYGVVPLVDQLTLRWSVRDLDMRAQLIARAVEESLVALLTAPARDVVRAQRVQAFLNRVITDERLFAIGFCDRSGALLYKTATLPADIPCPDVRTSDQSSGALMNHVMHHARGPLHVVTAPIGFEGGPLGTLLIVHDMSFVVRRSADTKWYIVYLFAAIGAVVALVTVV